LDGQDEPDPRDELGIRTCVRVGDKKEGGSYFFPHLSIILTVLSLNLSLSPIPLSSPFMDLALTADRGKIAHKNCMF